ncbi:hypothetical protein RZS08_01200, partial [Arthrospira platensis SPKY1]|nr:hypothetical protein [Arthrospira platensis SPKY1]
PLPWRKPPPSAKDLGEQLAFYTGIAQQREGYFGNISFVPIIRRGDSYERLVSFRLRVSLAERGTVVRRDPGSTQRSELSEGQVYKIAVSETGMHKLTYAFLKDELGMDI